MEKRQQIVSAILFLICLAVLSVGTVLRPKETISETENRTLASFPEVSADSLIDGTFMDGVETYAADHFLGRTGWVSVKNTAELLAGKQEIGGVYITEERLIQKTAEEDLDPTVVDRSIAAIGTFASQTETPVAMLLVPTAAAVYSDTLLGCAPNFDQEAMIERVTEDLRGKVTMLHGYDALYAARSEYIFYRTDHHWTSYGAYCVYQTAIRKLGFSPVSYDKYNISHVSSSFRGTLYSKCLYTDMEPDVLDLYTYEDGAKVTEVEVFDGVRTQLYDSVYFMDALNTKEQYQVYLGGNAAKITVKTDVSNGKRLLLIKDSYANSLLPFLTQHYSEIVLLDLRYIRGSYRELADPDDFSQVLILYNAVTFAEDPSLVLLGAE